MEDQECMKEKSASMENWQLAESIYEFSATDIDGNEVSLEKYRGYIVIICNVASKWSKAPVNYSQFAELHASYAERGLRILAFPCNQFGKQEPGTNAQIKGFVKKYNVQFDMFSKIDVNGDSAHPLWKWMKSQPKGKGHFGRWVCFCNKQEWKLNTVVLRIIWKCAQVTRGALISICLSSSLFLLKYSIQIYVEIHKIPAYCLI